MDNASSSKKTNNVHTVTISLDAIPKLHCPICSKAWSSLAGYAKHVKKHEPPGGFLCHHCIARFCHDDDLQEHMKTHKTVKCSSCTDGADYSIADYRTHLTEYHNGQNKPFVCNKCGVEYRSWEPYKRHSETNCDAKRTFKCEHCDMSFAAKYNLNLHIKSLHTKKSRFRCTFCGFYASQKSELLEHERTHKGKKPFKCEVCGKVFPDRESYVTHSSVHTGIRLVECKCCHVRFSCHSNLLKHRKSRPGTCGRYVYDNDNELPPPQGKKMSKSNNRMARRSARRAVYERSSSEDEREFMTASCASESDDDVPLASRLRAKPKVEAQHNGYSDSDDEIPDFEPDNSENEDEVADIKLPAPAKIKEEAYDTDFEYQDASLFVRTTCEVKQEGSISEIFTNEKDKLLDVLLNTDAASNNLRPFESLKVEQSSGILDEIADVPMLETLETELVEEDVLALKEPSDEDDTLFEISKKLKAKAKKQPKTKLQSNPENEATIKRKYRKRGTARTPSPQSSKDVPKRVAKLTKKELTERLRMINKVERSWKCPHCVKIYHIRKPYEKHLRVDHKLCEQDIKDIFKDSDAHEKLAEEVFKCKICGKIYLLEKRLETHMSVHGENGTLTFKCPCYCNIFFATKEEATEHAHKQHKDLLYCELCDKFMTGHDSLKNHMKNFHGTKPPRNHPRNLICDKCGKKFSGRTSLSDHVRSDCGRTPVYQCSECGKRLSTAGILKTHMLLHKADTPYQCDKCGKTFKVKAQYKSHLKTRHTDFKPYKCHLCPKEYPYRESLLTHMTVHTGIKRFLCNNCGKRFTCISNLQAHRKVHADTCGQLPLNTKATAYMGVQRGKLLIGAKPEAGMEYEETKTLIAEEVLDRDMPMAQELNFPSEPSAPLATVPLNYASSHLVPHIVLQTMQTEARQARD